MRKPEKRQSVAASSITTTKRTTHNSTNLSRRYLLFTADSQLVTPHAARGAAVALISVSNRSFVSRHIYSLVLFTAEFYRLTERVVISMHVDATAG